MALKPTIYKAQVELADSDRSCYESLTLTMARHPSETLERMAARLLAFCINYSRGLEFTRGLSTVDEPALWLHSDSGEIEHWIEVGQPEEPRLRKACGRARQVSLYTFGKSSRHLVETERGCGQRPAPLAGVAIALGRNQRGGGTAGSDRATQCQYRRRYHLPGQRQ